MVRNVLIKFRDNVPSGTWFCTSQDFYNFSLETVLGDDIKHFKENMGNGGLWLGLKLGVNNTLSCVHFGPFGADASCLENIQHFSGKEWINKTIADLENQRFNNPKTISGMAGSPPEESKY
jgi:hypothetical protein